jgi:hypothetical protein
LHGHGSATSLLQATIMAHPQHGVVMLALLYLFWNRYIAMQNVLLVICILAAVRTVRPVSWAALLDDDEETSLLTALCPTMFNRIPTGIRKARAA